jgi:hypothetical protein
MRLHLKEWVWRYGPAEVAGLLGAVLAAQLAWSVSGSDALAVAAGTWGETTAYYATMLARQLVGTGSPLLVVVRELILEFGFAEVLDTLVVRPTMMYAASRLFGRVGPGIVVGKLGADIVFYVPTIAVYELRKRQLYRFVVD